MGGERFVALGLAHARAAWFSELARWSTSAVIPIEFVKCVTIDEVQARLASGRPFSALLVDGRVTGLDRDLVDQARSRGCAVIVVADAPARRDWSALGASAVLPTPFGRDDLLEALTRHSITIARSDAAPTVEDVRTHPGWRGILIAVLGGHGVGSSTAAIALAQGLGTDVRSGGLVLLADLALDAEQSLLHDVGDVVPGIQEVVEAYRQGEPGASELHSLAFDVAERNYHLLLGLRRHRDWVSIRPRAFEAALDGLTRCYRAVVADVDADLEGEAQCGSVDVEDRNLFARVATGRADVVVVVGAPGPKGIHRMVRVVEALAEHHVDPSSVVPVINRAPRNPRSRAELSSAYGQLVRPFLGGRPVVAAPIFLPERRHVEHAVADGARLPASLVEPLVGAVSAVTARKEPRTEPWTEAIASSDPVPVRPGSLGSWSDDA